LPRKSLRRTFFCGPPFPAAIPRGGQLEVGRLLTHLQAPDRPLGVVPCPFLPRWKRPRTLLIRAAERLPHKTLGCAHSVPVACLGHALGIRAVRKGADRRGLRRRGGRGAPPASPARPPIWCWRSRRPITWKACARLPSLVETALPRRCSRAARAGASSARARGGGRGRALADRRIAPRSAPHSLPSRPERPAGERGRAGMARDRRRRSGDQASVPALADPSRWTPCAHRGSGRGVSGLQQDRRPRQRWAVPGANRVFLGGPRLPERVAGVALAGTSRSRPSWRRDAVRWATDDSRPAATGTCSTRWTAARRSRCCVSCIRPSPRGPRSCSGTRSSSASRCARRSNTARGELLVRNLIGMDPKTGALVGARSCTRCRWCSSSCATRAPPRRT